MHYIHRNLGRDELLAYYRAADIGLVTPLKDGMNLVAKEFCAAQIDERGVLIVSEFAGAGPELRSGAIIVNPNDFAEVAQALYDAAHMSADDKRCRMRLLRQIVKDHNVHRWISSFLRAIPEPVPAKGDPGGDSWEPAAKSTERSRKVMPGVALVAAALSPASRPRYAMGKDAKLRVMGSAAGERLVFLGCHPERSWPIRLANGPTKSKDPYSLPRAGSHWQVSRSFPRGLRLICW